MPTQQRTYELQHLAMQSVWLVRRFAFRLPAWVVMVLAVASAAQAADHGKRPWHLPWPCIDCGRCPDRYCPKPLPHVSGLRWCGSGDCYCPKPLPAVPCLEPGCGPCYSAKPLPCPPRCSEPWYRCVGGKAAGCGQRLLAPLLPAQRSDNRPPDQARRQQTQ